MKKNSFPASFVSTQNLSVRTSPRMGFVGNGAQYENAPCWNWNSFFEKNLKPVANESLQEFLARVTVHEGTHPESYQDFLRLSPPDQRKWVNDPTRFETKPYSKELKQINEQKENRKVSKH